MDRGSIISPAKILDLHLLELARSKDEIARRHFVAKRLPDLRDPEGQFPARRIKHILEVREYSLGGFGPKVCQCGRIIVRLGSTNRRAKHQVKILGIGQILRLAIRALSLPVSRINIEFVQP